jgi:LPXTG-motif cell wall-anchored protein
MSFLPAAQIVMESNHRIQPALANFPRRSIGFIMNSLACGLMYLLESSLVDGRRTLRHIISILAVAAIVAAMTAVAALPALAAQQPGPTTLTATGVLGQPFFEGQDPEPLYLLTDEETGTTYTLISGFVDLGTFTGQRVTIKGVRVPGIDPLAFNVTSVQPAPAGGGTTTAPGGGQLPATGGISLSLLPAVALVVGGGILGAVVLRRSR